MKSKKILFSMMVMVFLVLLVPAFISADDNVVSDLLPWKGNNETYINLFNTESGDSFFEEVANYADGYDAEMVYNYFAKMYETSFSTMKIVDAETVIFDDEIEAKYQYIGNFNTVWGEYSISWYIFRTENNEAIKAGYKHLIMMPYHGDGDGMKHCHMRYGNQNFDFLTTDLSVVDWWPTLFKTYQVDKEEVVQGMMKQVKMYSSMLPPLEK
ncbi:ZinT/AdcA family metal-binding protein [Iocasia frigidifontis]|uniref:ZinT/AdcA family metal-binding protein n=1 Tax=Iocasia fonsfrigidae TaxID=2682810 RepID=A0A8A7KBP1_9FIRM|nr:ZinT/AdcA family metal-binding protein [Iocasia fonsfrigidae]QTL98861.1 ZinT/AdcA family metal-binding protein [Iocasia fonsfrigidae]